MKSLIIEFQTKVNDKSIEITDLIRLCLIISTKLKNKEITDWLNKELYGYKETDNLPDYRRVPMTVKFYNPCYGWCPFVMKNEKMINALNQLSLRQKISVINELSKENNEIHFDTPLTLNKLLSEDMPFETDIHYICNPVYMVGIVNNIKDKMLEWILTLESNEIMDNNYIFDKKQIEKSKKIEMTIINNFYGDKNKIEVNQEMDGK